MSDALDVGSTAATADKGMYRQLLEEKIAEARLQIERLTADIHEATLAAHDIPADDEHDPEGSTLTLERAREVALLDGTEKSLAELLEAEDRLERGTYGTCENCGREIPRERLEVRPEARFCVQCASARRR